LRLLERWLDAHGFGTGAGSARTAATLGAFFDRAGGFEPAEWALTLDAMGAGAAQFIDGVVVKHLAPATGSERPRDAHPKPAGPSVGGGGSSGENLPGPRARSEPPRLGSDALRVAVGRERQRLLGLLQDQKPATKKVTKLLQRLQLYAADYPDDSAGNWLGPVYVDRSALSASAQEISQMTAAATEDDAAAAPGGATGHVLFVGSGDGSYEMSLMLAGATRVMVSFYESEARLRQRYTNFSCNASVLRALGATLVFEVDATDLGRTLTAALALARIQPAPLSNNAAATCEAAGESTASTSTLTPPSDRQGQPPPQQQQQYSRICFNFPQTGDSFPGSPNWHGDHATLLRAFFQSITEGKLLVGCCSCKCNEAPSESSSSSSTDDGIAGVDTSGSGSGGGSVSRGEGEVVVTLMDRAPYCELALDQWAADFGLEKSRQTAFSGGLFGLYRHRMTRYDRVVKQDAASSCHVYRYSAAGSSSEPAAVAMK